MDPTQIDPGFDRWVWLALAVFVVLLAARAWRVETAGPAVSRSARGRSVRVLTVAVVVAGLTLGGMLYKQGGEQLFEALRTTGQNIPVDPQAPAANLDPAAPAAPAAGN